jgi:hypothetical protein
MYQAGALCIDFTYPNHPDHADPSITPAVLKVRWTAGFMLAIAAIHTPHH